MSPDGSSKQIQRRLYINFQATYDNNSPPLLPIYVLIYGIKDEALNNIDLSIYDFEKYEISPLEYFKMHMLIDMNNQPIINLGHPAGLKDAVSKSSLSSIIKKLIYFWYCQKSTFSRNGRTYYSNAFISSDVRINFDSINIKSITLFNEGKYINKNDIIHLNYEDLGSCNFRSYQIRCRTYKVGYQ